jgi:mannose-6-phosphate isomerase-like protein (cupin superfamily)
MRGLVIIAALLASSGVALAQPAPFAADPSAPRDPPSNDATGVQVDRYIGYADRAMPHVVYDVMLKRTILSAGSPDGGAGPHAVMPYHKEVALLELGARNVTPLEHVPEQAVFYVESGEGTIDDGKQVWDVRPGIAVLIPPQHAHRFTSTGDMPLKLLLASQVMAPEDKLRADILVRDVAKLAFTERNGHWANMVKYVFLGEDGLHDTDHYYIVYMPSWTIAGAHAHVPGVEEVWIKLTDGPSIMQLGSEVRPWPANSGFMVPPNGRTVHAAINNSEDMQAWFYFSRLSAAPPPPRPQPIAGAAAVAEGVALATVAGRPLSAAKQPARR